jgi:hypothetical protein
MVLSGLQIVLNKRPKPIQDRSSGLEPTGQPV